MSQEKFYRAMAVVMSLVVIIILARDFHRETAPLEDLGKLQQSIASLEKEVSELRNKLATEPPKPILAAGTASPIANQAAAAPGVRAALQPTTPPPDDAPWFPTVYIPDGSFVDDPFIGAKESQVIVMAFSSFDCRTCRKFWKESFPALRKEFFANDKARFIFRDFPLSTQPMGEKAAIFANCVGEQGNYWKIHDLLYANPKDLSKGEFNKISASMKNIDRKKVEKCQNNTRVAREILADTEEGQRLGARGAPGFFLGKRQANGGYEGIFIRGAQPYEVFHKQLSRLVDPPSDSESNTPKPE